MKFVSNREPNIDESSGPAFIKPKEYVSFPDSIMNKITYLQINAESPRVVELPRVYGLNSFNAAVCQTTSRYFTDSDTSISRIRSTINPDGFLSHVK